MANMRNQFLDKTYLSIDQAERRGFIHRDYIAHCLRWSHFIKRMYERHTYERAIILDVGCGRELPLAKLLYSSKLIPGHYHAVDAGPIEDEVVEMVNKTGKFPCTLWENQNVLDLKVEDVTTPIMPRSMINGLPNYVVCFEMLEHVEPKMMMDILEHLKTITAEDCRFFFSTPVWNRVDCAGNHVNEMLYHSLGCAFERHGYIIKRVNGTFASIRDYENLLTAEQRVVFDSLRQHYDTNFLSCIFAPLFPEQSRNCIWELEKARKYDPDPKFPDIQVVQKPWSSSAKWEEMAL